VTAINDNFGQEIITEMIIIVSRCLKILGFILEAIKAYVPDDSATKTTKSTIREVARRNSEVPPTINKVTALRDNFDQKAIRIIEND
jgi:hypothetical protein